MALHPDADIDLLVKINAAVKTANVAEQSAATAQAELISRSKEVGLLLLEAKKLHPTVKDFDAFLKRIDGLKLSRAYDLMQLAGGRTTDEEIRKDTRDRVKKHRTKVPPAPTPKPEPTPISVTSTPVTESAEASAEMRKAENADLSLSAEEKAAKLSAHNLSEFQVACRAYLPNLIETDLRKARVFFMEGTWKPSAKRQEAA